MMRSSGYNTFGVLIGISGVEFMPMITPVPSRG
jgi:hypothetical protein